MEKKGRGVRKLRIVETPRKDGGEDSPGAAVAAEIVAIKWSHTAPLSCSAQCAKDRYEALYAYALDL